MEHATCGRSTAGNMVSRCWLWVHYKSISKCAMASTSSTAAGGRQGLSIRQVCKHDAHLKEAGRLCKKALHDAVAFRMQQSSVGRTTGRASRAPAPHRSSHVCIKICDKEMPIMMGLLLQQMATSPGMILRSGK